MKRPQVRFTTQEKFFILKEIDLIGLESILNKYNLSFEAIVQWQRKLKGTNTGNSIQCIKAKRSKKKDLKTKSEKPILSEKEEELLRLVASLIVENLLKKDSPDR